MAEETIFFNPGDAVASDYDFQAARRSAEIFKVGHASTKGLIVAKDGKGRFDVFYEGTDADPNAAKEKPTQYTILARL